MLLRLLAIIATLTAALGAPAAAFPVKSRPGFTTRTVTVDGCTISATIGGHGPAVVLLHGYAEASRMWKPLAIALAAHFTVIAPDLPGIGNWSIPSSGLDMTTSARRVHDAVAAWGYRNVRVVGHDIGLMVAYAYAAMYPSEVKRLALMDAFCPASPVGSRSTTAQTIGISASTVQRRWRSSGGASASISSIFGAASQLIQITRFRSQSRSIRGRVLATGPHGRRFRLLCVVYADCRCFFETRADSIDDPGALDRRR